MILVSQKFSKKYSNPKYTQSSVFKLIKEFSLCAEVTRHDTQQLPEVTSKKRYWVPLNLATLQAERSGQSYHPFSNVLVETKCNHVINFYDVFEMCVGCTVPKPNPKE